MIPFQYHPAILERFSLLSGGAMLGTNLKNGASPEPLVQAYLDEQRQTLQRIGSTLLSEVESLAGWRAAFRLFGVDPTQYRSAAEALLRRLTKKGDIPSINTVVDCCNLVSIRYALPVAAFDLTHLHPPVTVRFAAGDERFTPLSEASPEQLPPGEVIFIDKAGLVVARRWCWRQSEESAARDATQAALFTIEAQHASGKGAIEQALKDLRALLVEYAGGEYESALVV